MRTLARMRAQGETIAHRLCEIGRTRVKSHIESCPRDIGDTCSPLRGDRTESGMVSCMRVSAPPSRNLTLKGRSAFLRERFPDHTVVSDVGGGVNFTRPGLRSLLDACMRGAVSEVVVAHRDRLSRIGTGLIEHIIRRSGSVLTVLEDRTCDGSLGSEQLANDVLEVLTHFTARHNGKRSYQLLYVAGAEAGFCNQLELANDVLEVLTHFTARHNGKRSFQLLYVAGAEAGFCNQLELVMKNSARALGLQQIANSHEEYYVPVTALSSTVKFIAEWLQSHHRDIIVTADDIPQPAEHVKLKMQYFADLMKHAEDEQSRNAYIQAMLKL